MSDSEVKTPVSTCMTVQDKEFEECLETLCNGVRKDTYSEILESLRDTFSKYEQRMNIAVLASAMRSMFDKRDAARVEGENA
jgi:hypothetical protein